MPDFTWKELISSFTDDCEFAPPANEAEIAAAEQSLGLSLPLSLRSLLKESNGINGRYGLGVVWEVSAIALTNIQFRSNFKDLYMPFDGLLFFGDGGNGDQFAYPLLNNIAEVQRLDIFMWDHETDCRKWCAKSLHAHIEQQFCN
jgi:SMI1-KNR4 cell-wall